jgi:hypothetical protein
MLTWFLRWPTGIDNLRWGFSLCIPHRSCPCMDARWRAADVVVNVRRPSRCPGCLVPRYRPSSKILVNYYLVMPRHLMFVVSETWGLAPIRWGWEEWAQGAERTRSRLPVPGDCWWARCSVPCRDWTSGWAHCKLDCWVFSAAACGGRPRESEARWIRG